MSVLINSMGFPKSCSDCPLNYDEMSCAVTGTRWWSDTMVLLDFDYTKERLHDCPLSEVPSAQPKRNKGKWISYPECDCLKCDQCGAPSMNVQNFCYKCGADMRGEQDE